MFLGGGWASKTELERGWRGEGRTVGGDAFVCWFLEEVIEGRAKLQH